MLERFSEKARRALMFARYEAQQLGDRSIAGEHLLLALLREPEIDAVVATRNVNLAAIRDEIERAQRRQADADPDDEGLGEEARRILQLAGEEADEAAERLIDARHILFAILRDGRSPAASILTAQGITLDLARNELRTPLVRRAPGVYIAPAQRPDGARETGTDEAWALEGFTLTQALSRAAARGPMPFPESRIDLPSSVDAHARYDFVLTLAPGEHHADRGDLMLRGIERHFGVAIEILERPTDVYVLTSVDGPQAALKRSVEDFGGGFVSFSSMQFSITDPDGMPPTLEAFQARFPTPESWREAMAGAAIESMSVSNGSMEIFCHTLEEALRRPVVDETGLEGSYDIELSGEAGDLIDRLRRDLGLLLTPARRPVAWLQVRTPT